jgi:genome maintenance exonuclease 1|tara:strand:+ start:2000 stop:2683 length:684 start_codon:yes stop_codon:yes gene_type:complete
MANFVQLDQSKFPNTKGMNQNGFRFYQIDGKNYPSITSILSIQKKEGLEKWRKNVGEEAAKWEMARAARRGKATHTLVEQFLKGQPQTINDVLPNGMFRLLKPYLEQIDNIHCLEKIMFSHKLTLAGQVDCIAEYNGKLSVIDFKTANKERIDSWNESYYLQCTAYAIMYEELFGKPIEQIVILQAGEDGSCNSFVKQKKDYLSQLEKAIKDFYKYYEELNKAKINQ